MSGQVTGFGCPSLLPPAPPTRVLGRVRLYWTSPSWIRILSQRNLCRNSRNGGNSGLEVRQTLWQKTARELAKETDLVTITTNF